jgi:hypothetical protein
MLLAGSDWSSAFAQTAAILVASDARAQRSVLDTSILWKPFHQTLTGKKLAVMAMVQDG